MTDEELASQISSPHAGSNPYKRHELILGIQAERVRLAGGDYVVIVTQQTFDYEGLLEEVFLAFSKPSPTLAEGAAIDLTRTLLARQLARPLWEKAKWVLESENEAPYAPRSPAGSVAAITFERSFKLRASAYDTKYTIVRVLGPCGLQPLDEHLVRSINSKHELWSYLVRVGECELNPFLPRPQPE